MPEVDHFLGTDEVGSIAKAIAGTITRLRRRRHARATSTTTPRRAAARRRAHTAYVKIAEGCDRPCAFCIIPKLRGPQRSRTPESVVREARDLVAGGTREISLIAQDLTTYGTDLRGVKQASGPRTTRARRGWRRCCARSAPSRAWPGSACTTPTRPPAPTSCST